MPAIDWSMVLGWCDIQQVSDRTSKGPAIELVLGCCDIQQEPERASQGPAIYRASSAGL